MSVRLVGNHDTSSCSGLLSSGLFDGTGDYLTITDGQTDFDQTGDWTFDFWWRPPTGTSTSGDYSMFMRTNAGRTNGIELFYDANGLNINREGATVLSSTYSLVVDTWQHIAFERSGNNYTCYVDGTKLSAASSATAVTFTSAVNPTVFDRSGGSIPTPGNMDEVRFSSSARYGSTSFTVETGEYSVDGNTILLLHMGGADASTTFTDCLAHSITPSGDAQIDTAQFKF